VGVINTLLLLTKLLLHLPKRLCQALKRRPPFEGRPQVTKSFTCPWPCCHAQASQDSARALELAPPLTLCSLLPQHALCRTRGIMSGAPQL
jgi:hypothetical protein